MPATNIACIHTVESLNLHQVAHTHWSLTLWCHAQGLSVDINFPLLALYWRKCQAVPVPNVTAGSKLRHEGVLPNKRLSLVAWKQELWVFLSHVIDLLTLLETTMGADDGVIAAEGTSQTHATSDGTDTNLNTTHNPKYKWQCENNELWVLGSRS